MKIATFLFLALVLCACQSGARRADAFSADLGRAGLSLSVSRSLYEGKTNKAFHAALLLLKEDIERLDKQSRATATTVSDRVAQQSFHRVVLKYLEDAQPRLAATPATDHLALQIARVISSSLQGADAERAKELQRFFESRFSKERAFFKD
jgi:hypothetical protein